MAVPSVDDIIRLYEKGELSTALAQYRRTQDEEDGLFLESCVTLHNDGRIDLASLPSQPSFASLTLHDFFEVQQFFCEAIPRIKGNATTIMECCRLLIEQAGADGAAGLPNSAFCIWCQNNPQGGAAVISAAKAGDELARRFVTFALQASNDVDADIEFINSYEDDRRLSGMTALARTKFNDSLTAERALAALEEYISPSFEDDVRANAVIASFDVLKSHGDIGTAGKIVDEAAVKPGPAMLHAFAHTLWLHNSSLDCKALRKVLSAMEAVDPNNAGTLRILDMGLHALLAARKSALVFDFLTAVLQGGSLNLARFEMTMHAITRDNPQQLYELIVRWFLSGSIELCTNVLRLVDKDRTFDTSIEPLSLSSAQKIFLCRKAIGFLFMRPVACCSIIVSVLRAGDKDVERALSDLLFDPLLLSYGGEAKEYLRGVAQNDLASEAVRAALARDAEFYSGLEAAGTIGELHPSEYQRNVMRERSFDGMRAISKSVERQSVLRSLARRSTILYGKSSLVYVTDLDGGSRAVPLALKSFSASFEWPRREIVDPVGLDYMLRVFRLERLA